MTERTEFVCTHDRDHFSMAELFRQFGVSRKTGYKWLGRFESGGAEALRDLSRAPHDCPHRTEEDLEGAIIDLRRAHPTWGPKKLRELLERDRPDENGPAASTIGDILKRNGLVFPRRRRRKLGHPGAPTRVVTQPNQLWTADHKGWFKTRDGERCYPLTICDQFSRYILLCLGSLSTSCADARPGFERVFREFGLPAAIRSDNGVPFAGLGIARLSRLSVWWIRNGIMPELIEPGKPQQNARHERMHRTLKDEAAQPAANCRCQQVKFDSWRREFNNLRPHESLGGATPASLYTPSPRPYPEKVPEPQYFSYYQVRKVSRNAGIRWKSRWLNVGEVLEEEFIGLEPVADGIWSVFFCDFLLGRFDERSLVISGFPPLRPKGQA
jgi:transposase InsO family protein